MFSPPSVSSTYSAPRFAELSARRSRLLFSHRWIGQSTVPLDRRRSVRSQHSSVMYSRTRPTSHLSGPNRRSRPLYLEALPSPCGTPSGGRRVSERGRTDISAPAPTTPDDRGKFDPSEYRPML